MFVILDIENIWLDHLRLCETSCFTQELPFERVVESYLDTLPNVGG